MRLRLLPYLSRIRFQQISCGAGKLCANKLLFVKWLCIRSSTLRLPIPPSMCLSVPWHYWIGHEYVSKLTTLHTHTHTLTSHIQFISINRACFSCIFYAFYRAFQSNIYHTHVATREDLCQPHKLIKLDRKREREKSM